MSLPDIPILKFQLEGVKRSIQACINADNDALMEMVQKSLEETLSQEWVQQQINHQVAECVQSSISEVSNNHRLRAAITDMISENLTKVITEARGEKQ